MSETSRNLFSVPNLHLEILHLSKIPNHQIDIEDLQTLDSNNQIKVNPPIINIKSQIRHKKNKISCILSEERIKTRPKIHVKKVGSDKTVNTYNERERCDAFGNKITKIKRKQKISFLDQLNPKKQLAEIIKVQSYKYYLESSLDNDYKEGHVKAVCCCIII